MKMISSKCLPSRAMHCCSRNVLLGESFPVVLLQSHCEWRPSMPRTSVASLERSKCKILRTLRSDIFKASACLAAERCGDVVTACLTVVMVSGVYAARSSVPAYTKMSAKLALSSNHGITTFEICLHHKRTMLSTPGHADIRNGKAYATQRHMSRTFSATTARLVAS